MNNRRGFTLVETLVAIMIASMLGSMLFIMLNQINRTVLATDSTVDVYRAAALVQQQMERDLSGAFLPTQAFEPLGDKKKQGAQQAAPEQQQQPETAAQKDAAQQGKKRKITWTVLKKPFFVDTKESQFSQMTFITSNPLSVYISKQAGEIKPRMVRVTYTLEPEKNNPPYMVLKRQESIDLNAEKTATSRSYELARGIKTIGIELFVEHQEEKEKGKEGEKKQDKKQTPKKITYDKFKQWPIEKAGDEQKKQRKIPNMVSITLTVWDFGKKREETFSFDVVIPSDPRAHEPRPAPVARPEFNINLPSMQTPNQPTRPLGAQRPRGAQSLVDDVFAWGRDLAKNRKQRLARQTRRGRR